jgi:hypothetical protein
MSAGSLVVDLCGAGRDQFHTDACPWVEESETGEDVIVRLEVDRARSIRIEAHSVLDGVDVDPTLYLRSDCELRESEIWCHEDTDGSDEDFVEAFDAGDYFLVVDRHQHGTTTCGELEVIITPL